MGVFGEAIYGHDGQYKARVYNAQYVRNADGRIQLANARGLTEQDALNRVFASVSIGPQNDSAFILSLDSEMKGYSWAIRAARQTGSAVSGGYYHAVYGESTLSSLHAADCFLYFPFIPSGEYCVSLIRDPSSFTAGKRWEMNMHSVPAMRETRARELGRPLNLSRDLMRRLLPYIVSKVSVNARQFLYIRVPDQAPYEAYCLGVMHEILSMLPAGLRAGISAATNADPQQEQHFGILFQRSSFPARHATDIDLHTNAAYAFLNQIYVSEPMKKLLEQFVDYPELVDKCFGTMEEPVFGDGLPKSFQSYENYYGISALQRDQTRSSYLEECNRLLETTSEPTLRPILERVVLDEFRTAQDLDEAIKRDPAFGPVNSFSALTAYMQARNSILSFLREHGITYSAMVLYERLYSIASGAGVKNSLDFYEMVITKRQDLQGLREEEQRQILSDARESAWKEFIRMRGSSVEGPGAQAAADQFARLTNLDEKLDPSARPPMSEINWFNSYQRTLFLNQYRKQPSPETAAKILSIPEYDSGTGKPSFATREGMELIAITREMLERDAETVTDPEAAWRQIGNLLALEKVFGTYFRQWNAASPEGDLYRRGFYDSYEKALRAKAVRSMTGPGAKGTRLADVIRLASGSMPQQGQECVLEIERAIAQGIRSRTIPTQDRPDLYSAALTSAIAPELQAAYVDWVATEIRDATLEAEKLRKLYHTVRNPDEKLQSLYRIWSDKKGLIEDMKASRTLVRYLSNLIKANGAVSSYDLNESRAQMWHQLTVQEKTISAFTASIAYLFGKSADTVMRENSHQGVSKILQEECNCLIKDFEMGIYLDPDLSIAELFENVQQYCNWSNSSQVTLYSKSAPTEMGARIDQDLDGSRVYANKVSAEDLQRTLKYLLCILDGKDYSDPGGREVDTNRLAQELLGDPYLKSIMGFLEASRIIKINSDLGVELTSRGYAFSYGMGKKESGKPASDRAFAVIGGICILAFVLGAVFSFFIWPGRPAVTVSGKKPNEVTEEAATGASTSQSAGTNSSGTNQEEQSDSGTSTTVEGSDTASSGQTAGSDDSGTGATEESEPETNENTSILPSVDASSFASGDGDLALAVGFLDKVEEENEDIKLKDNEILLPIMALSSEKDAEKQIEDDYLVVMYAKWKYISDKDQMALDNPDKDVYFGYIKMTSGDKGFEKSLFKSHKKRNDLFKDIPEGVSNKIKSWDDVRDVLETYTPSLSRYIDSYLKPADHPVEFIKFKNDVKNYISPNTEPNAEVAPGSEE